MDARLKTLIKATVMMHLRQKSMLAPESDLTPSPSLEAGLYLFGLIFLLTFDPHFCLKFNLIFF